MANHKSAQKRAIQNEVRRLRNRTIKTRIKHVIKDLRMLIDSEPGNKVVQALNLAKSVIDNGVKKGVLHKKTASRKISRLSKMVNKVNH